jgi:thiopurine S-methyltransferase
MTPDFWHRRWQKNEIGFHESEGNHILKAYFDAWKLAPGSLVFVPLCGKTRDIAWLLNHGYTVVANELNDIAVKALFDDLGVVPETCNVGSFVKYTAPNLSVFAGDFFALTESDIGRIDGIYDRAALVALPQDLREQYVQHLMSITQTSRQFLVAFDYEQSLFAGPPFSVTPAEVERQYARSYKITCLHRNKVEGGIRGQSEAYEAVYLLDSEPIQT